MISISLHIMNNCVVIVKLYHWVIYLYDMAAIYFMCACDQCKIFSIKS